MSPKLTSRWTNKGFVLKDRLIAGSNWIKKCADAIYGVNRLITHIKGANLIEHTNRVINFAPVCIPYLWDGLNCKPPLSCIQSTTIDKGPGNENRHRIPIRIY